MIESAKNIARWPTSKGTGRLEEISVMHHDGGDVSIALVTRLAPDETPRTGRLFVKKYSIRRAQWPALRRALDEAERAAAAVDAARADATADTERA
jgi:hypothetical protein